MRYIINNVYRFHIFRQTVLCNVSAIASLVIASYPCTRIASGTKRGIDRDGRVFEQCKINSHTQCTYAVLKKKCM